ncbi:hypothetical protein BKA70DRAFT_1238603 [Coprinopsis sp. MPI-PUGE-AT-0042]|nr:hypothetical protein BKA70DRAFT_1238603 [Coprinopsis sp. MPI-PUGE-AT-0042]
MAQAANVERKLKLDNQKADETVNRFSEAGDDAKKDAQEYVKGDEESKETKKRGLMDRMWDACDNLKDRIPEEHKDWFVDQKDNTKSSSMEKVVTIPGGMPGMPGIQGTKNLWLACPGNLIFDANSQGLPGIAEESEGILKTLKSIVKHVERFSTPLKAA